MDIKDAKIFSEFIEQEAIDQFNEIIDHDEIVAGALMPDAHKGYTLPIGGVVASKGLIFPSFVGYDIGCGMCAIPTDFNAQSIRNNARRIWKKIQDRIPVGFNHHKEAQTWDRFEKIPKTWAALDIFHFKDGVGFRQLGTLGGGNHFIEIGADDNEKVWVIIHSGSRGIGHAIATHYMKIAGGGKAREGFFGLDVNSQDGKDYIKDLNFGLQFALDNRLHMMQVIELCVTEFCDGQFMWDSLINRNHNHAELENLKGHGDVWIHRKGATHASQDMFGVIPGNMRDGSFIVRGLGNVDSLFSSSHGAGRVLGRKKAKQTLSIRDFESTMSGIVANVDADRLDESPAAYKCIFQVMKDQQELVEVVAHSLPILNVKG
jgi:tRNA-splicing ligase RtcB